MIPKITLKIIKGDLKGQTFEFRDRDTCIMGRADECNPKLPNDKAHRTISRHHCLLDINPPQIRVRDFGSLNGTYINGEKIGQREAHQNPEEGAKLSFPERDLKQGDQIELGQTIFQVDIEVGNAAPISQTSPPQDVERLEFVNQLLAEAEKRELGELGEYRLVRKLGEGGFGRVYLAVKPTTQEVAALKVALPEVAAVPGQIERFQREILNNQSLRHPHIVRLFDNGYYQGVFFFTLEYCVGGSLDQLIRKRGAPLPVEEALPIILQVLEALEYAHNVELEVPQKNGEVKQIRGLVHRDLKPANILFTEDGIAKVSDYGLAKAFDLAGLSGLTCTGEAAGTPFFCPRQQVLDFKNCQPEVDVWAIAATLYFILTGHPPRNFKEGEDCFKKLLTAQAIPIRYRNPSIPSRLAKVIDQALIDEPEIPFKSANSLQKSLKEAMK